MHKFIPVSPGEIYKLIGKINGNDINYSIYTFVKSVGVSGDTIDIARFNAARIYHDEEIIETVPSDARFLCVNIKYSSSDIAPTIIRLISSDNIEGINGKVELNCAHIDILTDNNPLSEPVDEVAYEKGGYQKLIYANNDGGLKELYVPNTIIPSINEGVRIYIYGNYYHKSTEDAPYSRFNGVRICQYNSETSKEETIYEIIDKYQSMADAFAGLHNIIGDAELGYAYVDWTSGDLRKITESSGLYNSVRCLFLYDVNVLSNSKQICQYLGEEPLPNVIRFAYSRPIYNENELFVYVDGIKKFLNKDYTVDLHNRKIIFKNAPSEGSEIGFHYNSHYKDTGILRTYDLSNFINGEYTNKTKLSKYFTYNGDGNGDKKNVLNYTICDDPSGTNEKCIKFSSVNLLNVKSRSQVELCNSLFDNSIYDFENTVDVYLPLSTLDNISNYTDSNGNRGCDWYTIQEYWNSVSSNARVSIEINSNADGTIFFAVKCQSCMSETSTGAPFITTYSATKICDIPGDKWFTLNTKLLCALHGRFRMSIIIDDVETLIFDEDIPAASIYYYTDTLPRKMTYVVLSPLKLYHGHDLGNYAIEQGNPMTIYFKNWKYQGKYLIKNI